MSDGDLLSWIRFLHAAAQVPKGSPDYADAQQAVARAKRKIAFINREANRHDVATPGAVETARMSALANTVGDVAAFPASILPTLAEVPLPVANMLGAFIKRRVGNLALDARGVDTKAYERGMEAHPTATAIGEMVPPTLMALAGGVGRKPMARSVDARLEALTRPSTPTPPTVRGLLAVGDDIGAVPTQARHIPQARPVPDQLDVPTFLRRPSGATAGGMAEGQIQALLKMTAQEFQAARALLSPDVWQAVAKLRAAH